MPSEWQNRVRFNDCGRSAYVGPLSNIERYFVAAREFIWSVVENASVMANIYEMRWLNILGQAFLFEPMESQRLSDLFRYLSCSFW